MTQDTKGTNRRNFLKLAGTAAPAAGVAVGSCGSDSEAQTVDLQSDKMQDTAHTRAYLESTRF